MFRFWAVLTIFTTIVLIGVGGLVRATGSGMGCPDWPKCFGQIVPPTSEAQLPADYQAHYVVLRQQKNIRVAKTMRRMGFTTLADRIEHDPSVAEPEAFNATKTWIEYLNRLLGALTGLFIFITLLFSFGAWKTDKRIALLSFAGFILVGLEGWLGSLVVSTNLMPDLITAHMFLAMLVLVTLVAAAALAYRQAGLLRLNTDIQSVPSALIWGGVGVSTLILAQIIIGTQVRERVDVVAKAAPRMDWIANLGDIYTSHTSFYFIVTAAVLYWASLLWKRDFFQHRLLRFFTLAMVISLLGEIGLGATMHCFAIPAFAQPAHLLLATTLFTAAISVTGMLRFG